MTHVWTYIESALACNNQFEKIPMMRNQDVKAFSGEYDIIDFKDLPEPEGVGCSQCLPETSS